MSAAEMAYDEGIHDVLDGIQMPDDDGITTSSFDNSKIDGSRSLNLSRKTQKRGIENNFEENFNKTSNGYEIPDHSLSPYEDNREKTLTIYSLNSSGVDDPRYPHEEQKHANSPSSLQKNEFNMHDRNHDYDKYHDTESMDYYDHSDDNSPDFNNKSHIELTKETDDYFNNDTKDLIRSARDRENDSEDDEYEGEESEYGSDDSNSKSNLGYNQDTINSNSNYNDHSLIDQTQSQFINGKDLTSGLMIRQSQGENTHEIPPSSMYRSESDYEGEESEVSQDESLVHDSQISGMASLSRTDNSKYSRNKYKKSSRYSRSGHRRSNRGASPFNDTNSNYREEDATDSLGIRTRKGLGQESYYETESQSVESWGARTPQDAIVQPRRTQAIHDNQISLRDNSRSPEGRSLIIDSNPRVSRIHNRDQEITEQSYSRSNMFESSHGDNTQTVNRKKRRKKEEKKKKKTGSKAPKGRASNIIAEDRELESVLSRKAEGNSQLTPQAADVISHPYVFTTDSEDTGMKPTKFEMEDYRKLKFENRELKAKFHELSLEKETMNGKLGNYLNDIDNLNRKCIDEEQQRLVLQDKLQALESAKGKLTDKQYKKIKSKELSKARDQLADLKHSYSLLERENAALSEKCNQYDDMEHYFISELEKYETMYTAAKVSIESLEREIEANKILEQRLAEYNQEINDIKAQANRKINSYCDQIAQLQNIIEENDIHVESLEKQLRDNQHLLESDQDHTSHIYKELQKTKEALAERESELAGYQKLSHNNTKQFSAPGGPYVNQEQVNALKREVAELTEKYKQEKQLAQKIEKELKRVKGNHSSQDFEEVEIVEQIKAMLDIEDNSEICDLVEQLKIDQKTIEPLEKELNRARAINSDLKQKVENLMAVEGEGGQNYTNNYLQKELDMKNNELRYYEDELNVLDAKLQQSENEKHQLNTQLRQQISDVSNLQRLIREREAENESLIQLKENAEYDMKSYKEASTALIKEKRDLLAKLEQATQQDQFERSQSQQDYGNLKTEANSLIDFVLSIQFAFDKDLDDLYKNQSSANEFDRAKKHLENQKEMVNAMKEGLEHKYASALKELDTFKQKLDDTKNLSMKVTQLESECQKWKQNYDRITLALKSNQENDGKDSKEILADYKIIQEKVAGLESEIIQKEKLVQEQKGKILKLEDEAKKCYAEIDNQKLIAKDYYSKYQSESEKASQIPVLEAKLVALEGENQSLSDQNTVLKKSNSEQLKSFSQAPVEFMNTIKSLKSANNTKDLEIKELRAQNEILESLRDEAREEFKKYENGSFNDAIEILDLIITKSITQEKASSEEFGLLIKRVKLIKDQNEEQLVYKLLSLVKQYMTTDFSQKENECKSVDDYKNLISQMLAWYRDNNKVSVNESDLDPLNISTESKSHRKTYSSSDSCIDISEIFDQYVGMIDNIHKNETERIKQDLSSSLSAKHEKYAENLKQKFEDEKRKLNSEKIAELKQMEEKMAEVKQMEEKIKADFDAKRNQMYTDFEVLKSQLREQFSEQVKKYENSANDDINKQKEELDKQKKAYEQEFSAKIETKLKALTEMFEKRKVELEREYKIKQERLDFEMKTKTKTQDLENKSEFEALASKIESQCQDKIERIEAESDQKIQEFKDQLSQKDDDINKLKAEYEHKLKNQRKTIDREIKFKSENLEKEVKMKVNSEAKKHQEKVDKYEQELKELGDKLLQEKQRHKELLKSNSDKHKAEINNLKSNQKNELIRKEIEYKKELKKAQRDLEIEIDELKHGHEQNVKEKLSQQKKELSESYKQKMKLDKSKHEQELLNKENEINQKFKDKELELHKQHEKEIEELREKLTKQHEKLMESVVEHAKAEVKEQYREELDHEVMSATEKVKGQYLTENQTLKMRLQELYEVQSNATSSHEDRLLNIDSAQKLDESLQTDDIQEPDTQFKRSKNPNTAFDYAVSSKLRQSQPTLPLPSPSHTQMSLESAQNNHQLHQALLAKNIHDLNTLQKKYELRITALLEGHMKEIQETKVITIQKLERVLVLEFEKLLKATTSQDGQFNSESADLIISELIADLTSDSTSAKSIQNITLKLNQVLKHYKEKTDAKVKHVKNKLQKDFILEKKKLQDEYERMRKELEKHLPSQSPSILDTGDENGISPEKRIRKTIPKQFTDFTKEFRLCDRDVYEKNIITKVCPAQEGKAVIVDLERIVSDLNMIKNSLNSAAKQLGFVMVEPHKVDSEEFQEQMDPNVPEPVYNMSQQYRHLLNTLLRFSRDLIVNSNGGDFSENYIKNAENTLLKHKQDAMAHQLQISDLKDKLKNSQKDLKMLQRIFENHCESRLQIVDFSIYDRSLMTEITKHIIAQVKNMHTKIMDLQTIFLTCGKNMDQINEQCYNAYREMEEEGEHDSDYSDEKDRPTAATHAHKASLQPSHSQNLTTLNHPDMRKSYEVGSKGPSCMAQMPRASFVGGSITARSNFASPSGSKIIGELANRGSTESTKNPYNLDSNNSFTKPPKCNREARGKCMQERYKINQPNKSLERRNSFSHIHLNASRNHRSGLASTQSLKNLSNFISSHSLRDQDDIELSRAQESANILFKKLMKQI